MTFKLGGFLKQALISLIAVLQSFDIGCSIGWSMPAKSYLEKEHPRRLVWGNQTDVVPPFSNSTFSWMFSSQSLVLMILCLLFSHILKNVGPCKLLNILGAFKVIYWGILLFTNTTPFNYIMARSLLGIGHMLFATVPLYIEEITDAKYRGFFICFSDSSINSGILFAFIIGSLFSFDVNLWILFIFSMISWIACLFLPESPIWLKEQGKNVKALKSLKRVRSINHNFETELNNIDKYLKTRLQDKMTLMQLLKLLKTQSHYCKSLFIIIFLFALQHLSIISLLQHYTTEILRNTLNEFTILLITGFGCLLGSVTASCYSDRFGRRPLLLVSEAAVAVSLAILALYTFNILTFHLIPMIAVCFHVFMVNIGLGPIPYVVMAELLPCQIRCWGSYIGILAMALINFLVNRTFDSLREAIGVNYVFVFYSIINVIGFIFIWMFLPETKGIPRHLMEKTIFLNNSGDEKIDEESLKELNVEGG